MRSFNNIGKINYDKIENVDVFEMKNIHNTIANMDDDSVAENYLRDLFGDYPMGEVSSGVEIKGLEEEVRPIEASISISYYISTKEITQNVAFMMEDGRRFGTNPVVASIGDWNDYFCMDLWIYNDGDEEISVYSSSSDAKDVEKGCSKVRITSEIPRTGRSEILRFWLAGNILNIPVKWID
jgi:hypothetical protein